MTHEQFKDLTNKYGTCIYLKHKANGVGKLKKFGAGVISVEINGKVNSYRYPYAIESNELVFDEKKTQCEYSKLHEKEEKQKLLEEKKKREEQIRIKEERIRLEQEKKARIEKENKERQERKDKAKANREKFRNQNKSSELAFIKNIQKDEEKKLSESKESVVKVVGKGLSLDLQTKTITKEKGQKNGNIFIRII